MRSYAEKVEATIVDWEKELTAKQIDWERLRLLVEDWNTCSIGQLSELIERSGSGSPDDANLEVFSEEFTTAVKNQDAEIALIWLKRTKNREKELLSELLVNRKNEVKEISEYLKKVK